jgi:Sec-independent protein secretion pathway component TatC
MKAASSVVFSIIWLIVTMMIGFIITSQLILNANTTGALNGSAASPWLTFVAMIWVSFGILALTPLVLVALMFLGLFGGAMGGGQ